MYHGGAFKGPLYNSPNSAFAFRPSSPSVSSVVRQGPVSVKEDGTFASWMWRYKWLTLDDAALSLHKSENSPQQSVILLCDIAKFERTELKPYCLLLETQDGKRYFLSLKNDEELYGWQDDVYSRSPLMAITSNPTNFVHNVHVAFDPVSGAFTGMPDQWSKLLTKSAIAREDYARNPQAVLDVLEFYADHQKRELERETDMAARFNAGTSLGSKGKLVASLSASLDGRPAAKRQESALPGLDTPSSSSSNNNKAPHLRSPQPAPDVPSPGSKEELPLSTDLKAQQKAPRPPSAGGVGSTGTGAEAGATVPQALILPLRVKREREREERAPLGRLSPTGRKRTIGACGDFEVLC
ncbi:P21-Rho-binding domain-containing protein [Mycena rebaudengoi]|nr:P21-Rho-binding domain-containing protein [Mycena rebaudengoi]